MEKKKQWKYHDLNKSNTESIVDQFNVTPLVAEILSTYGFSSDSPDELTRFMSFKMDEVLSYEGLTCPNHLAASFNRLRQAKENNEKIVINGDPDADGISGTVILTTGLRKLGFDVTYDFPIRSKEGHGLQLRIIQEAKKNGASLIITTDCGTKDVEAVDYANENGIDVIITDHHILGKRHPNAVAIINPYLNSDEKYKEFRQLSGSFVSFKWIIGLKEFLNETFPKPHFETLVIAASLGVVSDRVSLRNPMNRAVVKLGVDYLNNTKLPGVNALKKISVPSRSFIRARDISRTISPRMNAPGRIGDPSIGVPDSSIIVDLLMAELNVGSELNVNEFVQRYKELFQSEQVVKNKISVDEHVVMVDKVNDKRKKMTEEIANQIEVILSETNIEDQNVLIIQGNDWNSGVIGIDADRLRDRFVLPAIIVTTLEGSDFVKGSVRSIPTIDMYRIMEHVQNIFEDTYGYNPYRVKIDTLLGERYINAFGGHSQACGFSMSKDDVNRWADLVRAEMKKLPASQFEFSYKILKDIDFFHVNPKTLQQLDTLSPYGEGFDYPIFRLKGVTLSDDPRPFGNRMQKDRTPHVEFKVLRPSRSSNKTHFLMATGFGLWETYQSLSSCPKVDLIFTIEHPRRRGSAKKVYPQINVIDMKPAS